MPIAFMNQLPTNYKDDNINSALGEALQRAALGYASGKNISLENQLRLKEEERQKRLLQTDLEALSRYGQYQESMRTADASREMLSRLSPEQVQQIQGQTGQPVVGAGYPAFQNMPQFQSPQVLNAALKAQIENTLDPLGVAYKKAQIYEKTATKPESSSQFVAALGRRIVNGTATEEDRKIFKQMTDKAGTTLNVNTGDVPLQAKESSERLQQMQVEADKWNEKNTDKEQRMVVTTDTKGNNVLAFEQRDPTPEGVAKETVQVENLQKTVKEIRELYNPNMVGLIQGGLMGWAKDKTGFGLGSQEAEFRTLVKSLIKKAYIDSGKQLSDKEMERLLGFLPNTTAADKTFDAQINLLERELEYSLKRSKEISSAGGRVKISDNNNEAVNKTAEQFGF